MEAAAPGTSPPRGQSRPQSLAVLPVGVINVYHETLCQLGLWQAGSHATFCSKLMTRFFNLGYNAQCLGILFIECYCVLHLLGFNYFMSVRRR